MEKLKKEFEQLFTKDATEIASIPKRRLAGNPQELWLWILNNFNVKVSQMQLPVKPANDNHAIKYAINELTTLEGLLLEAREMDAKTLNKAISILSQLRNRLHNRLSV